MNHRIAITRLVTFSTVAALLMGGAPRAAAAGAPPNPGTIVAGPAASQPGWAGMSVAIPATDPLAVHHNPSVAVGPEHVVQILSGSIQVWTREGASTLGPTSIKAARFFNLPARFEIGDATVLFDSVHGRWVATETSWACDGDGNGVFNDPKSNADVIVSRTADPLGIWELRRYQIGGATFDGSSIGTSSDKLAIAATVVQWSGAGTPYCFPNTNMAVESNFYVTDWIDVLAGGAVTTIAMTWGPRVRFARQMPATSPALHLVAPYSSGISTSPMYAPITGSAVGNSVEMKGPFILAAAPLVEPPDPRQPGGGVPFVTSHMDARLTDVIWQDNKLTFASTNGCTPTGDVAPRACVRITQVRTSSTQTAPPPVLQDFLIGSDHVDNYLAGLGQSADGTLYATWNRSSGTDYVTPVAAYQDLGDPANQMTGIEVLHAAGGSPIFSDHWGDFAGLAPDPQVPNAAWQGTMYVGPGGEVATEISQLQTASGSSYVPITPLRVVDSRTPVGVAGIFNANVPQTFLVAGASTIPADAVAVTGNVTVTGQTAAGFVAITPSATTTPQSSTINFPLGDTRANNFTSPLAASGRLAAVYKAAAGKKAHVIVDITGYFLAGDEDATYKTLTPVRVMDTRPAPQHVGPLNKFHAGISQTLSIAADDGIPASAVAITGNLTITGQTKAGYLSVTPDQPIGVPGSSTVNVPLGDTRANGLTAQLNATGDIWITYTAQAGATAEVILDVTGFYVPNNSGLLFYPLTPGRILDTRPGAVLSGLPGLFTASSPRRLDTDGHWGVPNNAEAVTGNLTVVNQTAAGFLAITPTNDPAPPTSTMNFPLGDIRANGVTVPLNASGNMFIVYKAATGKKTNVLLDLSGYFK